MAVKKGALDSGGRQSEKCKYGCALSRRSEASLRRIFGGSAAILAAASGILPDELLFSLPGRMPRSAGWKPRAPAGGPAPRRSCPRSASQFWASISEFGMNDTDRIVCATLQQSRQYCSGDAPYRLCGSIQDPCSRMRSMSWETASVSGILNFTGVLLT